MPWTTARSVETGLLAEESLVLHCAHSRVSLGVGSLFPPRWCCGCAFGVVFSDGLVDVRLARKNSPEMLSCSQRTTTTFWPFRSCLATVEARRPRRWPLPSTTTCVYPSAIAVLRHFPYILQVVRALRRSSSLSGNAYHRLEGRHFAAVSMRIDGLVWSMFSSSAAGLSQQLEVRLGLGNWARHAKGKRAAYPNPVLREFPKMEGSIPTLGL